MPQQYAGTITQQQQQQYSREQRPKGHVSQDVEVGEVGYTVRGVPSRVGRPQRIILRSAWLEPYHRMFNEKRLQCFDCKGMMTHHMYARKGTDTHTRTHSHARTHTDR